MIVHCPCAECKYNGKNNKCKAKSITLSAHSVSTLWEGHQDYWKCKSYESSKRAREIQELYDEAVSVFDLARRAE